MFFSRGCNRGKSKLIVRDYQKFVDEDGQTKVKRVKSTVRILEGVVNSRQDDDGASSSSADDILDLPDASDRFNVEVDPGPSHYEKSSASAVKHWQEIRANLIKVSLKREGLLQLDKECSKCKAQTAQLRCLDCGGSSGFFLCESCCICLHSTENILHCPEIWKDGKWEQYIFTKTFATSCFDPDCAEMGHQINLSLTLIDDKGIVSSEVIQQWLEEEKSILINKNAPKGNKPHMQDIYFFLFTYCIKNLFPVTFPEGHEWIMEYFQLLRKFYALRCELLFGITKGCMSFDLRLLHFLLFRENVILQQVDESCERHMGKLVNQLLAIEKAHKIPMRWKPTDQEFQNTLVASEAASARSTLNLLLMSGRRRWFLLSLVKKYADGQAQAYRITKAVTKESKILKNLLKKFNASVQILKEHGRFMSTLSWDEVTNVASSSLYTSTPKSCDQEIVPDAIKREIIDAYNLCQRAGEELCTLNQEMSRIIHFFYEECKDLEQRNEVTLRRRPDIPITLWAGQRSVLLRKLHFCQRHLLFSVESFKALIAIPTNIDDYLKNSICINIPYDHLMNEMDECGPTEDVKVLNPLEYIIDEEKGDYLFRDDNDSGFASAYESSIPPDITH